MNFGNILPPGINNPYTFGYQLRQQIDGINKNAQSLRLRGLQQQFLVFKSLGSLGAKGLESISKQADQLAKRSLSPLDYALSRGRGGSGLTTFRIDV